MATYSLLSTLNIPPGDTDAWRLFDWSTNEAPFPILVRASQAPPPPVTNNTYGWCGIYQVAAGRLLVFNNQRLFALPDNGGVWGTVIPPSSQLLVNLPATPLRYPWGVIVSIQRWMIPCTLNIERISNP